MSKLLSDRIQSALEPQPICRECADNDGRCPHTNELCDPHLMAKELSDLVRDLEYFQDATVGLWATSRVDIIQSSEHENYFVQITSNITKDEVDE